MTLSFIDNGIIKLGVNTQWGGGIAHISEMTGPYADENVVDDNDQGRMIQQSYYGSNPNPYIDEESIIMWADWPFNPIQGGDAGGNAANILAFESGGSSLYTKTKPRDWGLNDWSGTGEFTPGIMEQWVSLQGKVVTVRFKYVYDGTYAHSFREQECPAFFIKYGVAKRFVSYEGSAPWTDGALTSIYPGFYNLTDPNNKGHILAAEKWAAYTRSPAPGEGDLDWKPYTLDEDAIGLFSPIASDEQLSTFNEYFDNWLLYHTDNTSYMSPQFFEAITPTHNTFDYTFHVAIGSVSEIRKTFHNIHLGISAHYIENDRLGGNYQPGTLVTLNPSDLRGIGGNIRFRWNADEWQTYTGPFLVQTGTLEWQGYDASYGDIQTASYTTPVTINEVTSTADGGTISYTTYDPDGRDYSLAYSLNNGASYTPERTESPGAYTLTLSGLAEGTYQVLLRITPLTGDTTPVYSETVELMVLPASLTATAPMPAVSLTPSVVAPSGYSVRTVSAPMPPLSIQAVVVPATASSTQTTTAQMPTVSLQPSMSIFEVESVMVAGTVMPAVTAQPIITLPVMSGVTSGTAIRAPNGDIVTLYNYAGSPVQFYL